MYENRLASQFFPSNRPWCYSIGVSLLGVRELRVWIAISLAMVSITCQTSCIRSRESHGARMASGDAPAADQSLLIERETRRYFSPLSIGADRATIRALFSNFQERLIMEGPSNSVYALCGSIGCKGPIYAGFEDGEDDGNCVLLETSTHRCGC